MGLFSWIGKRSRRPSATAEQTAPKPPVSVPDPQPVGYPNEVWPLLSTDRANVASVVQAAMVTPQEQFRQARYAEFDRMDTGDVAASLDAFVAAALTFDAAGSEVGFKLNCDNATVKKLLQTAIETADLCGLAEEVLRDALKYGDAFAEPLFQNRRLCGAQTYNSKEIWVTRDDKGQLLPGEDINGIPAAFQQKRLGRVVAGWKPYEMLHLRYRPVRKLTYSAKSLLDDYRSDWRKLQQVEMGMVVARVSRAYATRVHKVDMTNKDRVEQERSLRAYIDRTAQRVMGKRPKDDNGIPLIDVSEDLYVSTGYTTGPDNKPVPKLNDVSILDTNLTGLSELGDVEYLRRKLFTKVPSDVVGIPRTTSGETDNQDIAYGRELLRCQLLLDRFMRGILDQVLLADGRLPGQVVYSLQWPNITVGNSWRGADARFRDSLTVRNHLEMSIISRRFALKRVFNLSDKEIDDVWADMEQESKSQLFKPIVATATGNPTPDPNTLTTTRNGIPVGTDLGKGLKGHSSGGGG